MKYKYEIGQWVYFMRDTGKGHDVSYGMIVKRFESQDARYVSRMSRVGTDRNRPAYLIFMFKNCHKLAEKFVFDHNVDDEREKWYEYEFNIVQVAPSLDDCSNNVLHSRMKQIHDDYERGLLHLDTGKHMTNPFIVSV